jgi:hypothetical protein
MCFDAIIQALIIILVRIHASLVDLADSLSNAALQTTVPNIAQLHKFSVMAEIKQDRAGG